MSKTERLYRNKATFNYVKTKNNRYYIENNDNDNEEQNFESKHQSVESFESKNEIFDEEEENQEFFQEENQIVLHQSQQESVILYFTYFSQKIDIKQIRTQN